MNGLILPLFAVLAVAKASHIGGAVVAGPSGVVTGHGAIGPVGAGLGWGHGGAVLAAPAAGAVIAGPAVAAPAIVAGPAVGLGLGAWGHGVGAWGHGVGAITAGGGAISATSHGAAIRGPPTAPVVVSGPSGKVAADGLWGPTANVGAGAWGGHGAWAGHGGWAHGGHW